MHSLVCVTDQGAIIMNMDCLVMSVFCVHLDTVYTGSSNSSDCQKLVAEQLFGWAGGTVRHGRRYGPPITVQTMVPPPIPLL
jgi:hypothetical protein